MIKTLGLKQFELIIIIDICKGSFSYYEKHEKNWNEKNLNANHSCHLTDNKGVISEFSICEFMEKCIMQMAEHSKVLFVTN